MKEFNETIVMFANVSVGQNVQPSDTNKLLKIFMKVIFLKM